MYRLCFLLLPFSAATRPLRLYDCVSGSCRLPKRGALPSANATTRDVCEILCDKHAALWPYPNSFNFSSADGSPRVLIAIASKGFNFQVVSALEPVKALLGQAIGFFNATVDALIPASGRQASTTHALLQPVVVAVTITVTDDATRLTLGTDESYSIGVRGAAVAISAATFFGARHALETLSQLIVYDALTGSLAMLSAATIVDAPAYPYRGVMIDVGRNFIPISAIKKQVRAMSYSKMNSLHLHLTDTASFPLEIPSEPRMAEFGAFSEDEVYTAADIAELVAYSTAHGVRVIPEIDAPAHARAGWQWLNDQGNTSGACSSSTSSQGIHKDDIGNSGAPGSCTSLEACCAACANFKRNANASSTNTVCAAAVWDSSHGQNICYFKGAGYTIQPASADSWVVIPASAQPPAPRAPVLLCNGDFNGGPHGLSGLAIEAPAGQFNVVSDRLWPTLTKVYNDVVSMFTESSEFFHMGGDEIQVGGCWNDSHPNNGKPILDAIAAAAPPYNDRTSAESFIHVWQGFATKAIATLNAAHSAARASADGAKEQQLIMLWGGGGTWRLVMRPDSPSILPIASTVVQVWDGSGAGSVAAITKQGYRVVMSHYDRTYLDCGAEGWINAGKSYCGMVNWRSLYGYVQDALDDAAGVTASATAEFANSSSSPPSSLPSETITQNERENATKPALPLAFLQKWRAIKSDEIAAIKANVIGAEAASWGESQDQYNVESRIWPRAAALAENLWATAVPSWQDSSGRFAWHRERLVRRGIAANALQPRWCLQHGAQSCGNT